MKRAHKLSDSERAWLDEVFDASVPELRLAWVLKEQFAAIYDAPQPSCGRAPARRLDVFREEPRFASWLKDDATGC